MHARVWMIAIVAAAVAAAAFLATRLKEHPGRHMRLEIARVSMRGGAPVGMDREADRAIVLSYGTVAPTVREIVITVKAKAACDDGDVLARPDVVLRLDDKILDARRDPGAPDQVTRAVAKYGFKFPADAAWPFSPLAGRKVREARIRGARTFRAFLGFSWFVRRLMTLAKQRLLPLEGGGPEERVSALHAPRRS